MSSAVIAVTVSAVVAIFTSITAPLIIIRLGDRARRLDREAGWARQDALAAKAATAAAEIKAQADAADKKLDQIHGLVNSNMTAAMTAEAAAVERELAGMLEIIELRKALGQEPSGEALGAVDAIRGRLAELQSQLADRARQAEIAERLAREEGDG